MTSNAIRYRLVNDPERDSRKAFKGRMCDLVASIIPGISTVYSLKMQKDSLDAGEKGSWRNAARKNGEMIFETCASQLALPVALYATKDMPFVPAYSMAIGGILLGLYGFGSAVSYMTSRDARGRMEESFAP